MRINTKLLMIVILMLLGCIVTVNYAYPADLNSCIAECNDKYPPVVDPPTTTKAFPDSVSFEPTTTSGPAGHRGAAVILPASWNGKISSVSLNGETALKDKPWQGRPLFRFTKDGWAYSEPLRFLIYTPGVVYSYTYGIIIPPTPTEPGGVYKGKYNTSTSDGYRTLRASFLGTTLGRSIKLVYENGYTVTVPDTSKRYEIGNRIFIYRCGGPGKDNETSHGYMGIWASSAKDKAASSGYVKIWGN